MALTRMTVWTHHQNKNSQVQVLQTQLQSNIQFWNTNKIISKMMRHLFLQANEFVNMPMKLLLMITSGIMRLLLLILLTTARIITTLL